MGHPVKLHVLMPGMINPLDSTKPTARASCDRLADVVQPEVQYLVDKLLDMRPDTELESVEVVVQLRYKK